jgi:hypothetical protein
MKDLLVTLHAAVEVVRASLEARTQSRSASAQLLATVGATERLNVAKACHPRGEVIATVTLVLLDNMGRIALLGVFFAIWLIGRT